VAFALRPETRRRTVDYTVRRRRHAGEGVPAPAPLPDREGEVDLHPDRPGEPLGNGAAFRTGQPPEADAGVGTPPVAFPDSLHGAGRKIKEQ